MKNTVNSLLMVFFVGIGISGCKKETLPPDYNFTYTIPTAAQSALCDPAQGGTVSKCMTLTESVRLGVAVTNGLGSKNPGGQYGACQAWRRRDVCFYMIRVQNLPYPSDSDYCVPGPSCNTDGVGSEANINCMGKWAIHWLDQAMAEGKCLF